ncbi:phosphatase PAP2 family protein [Streptomyces tagetis]|uniref:Phosphatase PAP2 family protein n=1 Tax=Streptomyces tagetis TaxID=2820809 RepID=A0A940XGJ3_9ACTN|nr:phosphatase PAP2 family protein [Streptomyces sp. RG38]MBQ0826742.1 phosphatase PAP2 family protein [Streptomyces sp. RG38]
MHSPSVVSPPRHSGPHGAVRVAGALALASVLLTVAVALSWAPLTGLDGDVARVTHRWALREGGVTGATRFLSDWVWDPWTMRLLCAGVVVWLWGWFRDRWTAVWLAVTCAVGSVLQQVLKAAVDRPRPFWARPVDSASYAAFPSGHAMTATVVCGALVWLLYRLGAPRGARRTASAAAVVCVVGVGATRVWLGVHWPSDVVGGWLLGGLLVALAALAHERWHPEGVEAAGGTGRAERR